MKRLVIFALSILFFSCSPSNKDRGTDDSEFFLDRKNNEFKNWLADTLMVISDLKASNSEKISIEIDKDSLGFYLYSEYIYHHTDQNVPAKSMQGILELLDENSQLPSKNYQLSFVQEEFYYPSRAQQNEYELDFRLEDVELLTKDSLFTYDFIRGRLEENSRNAR